MSSLTISPQNLDTGYGFDASSSSRQSQELQQFLLQLISELAPLLLGAMQPGASGGSGGGGAGGVSPGAFPESSAPASVPPVTPAAGGSGPSAATPPVGGVSGASGSSGSASLTNNAGGVAQAAAVSGVSPASTQVLNTGTGNDKTFNVTNNTSGPESFTYSVQGNNKATMTLQPGQTGTFVAGSGDIGVRISPSDANGNTHPNEVLYEDGGADNGQAAGEGNPDVSKVDGNKDFNGNAMNMTVTLSNGRTAGDGDAIRPYMYSTDDAAAMGLAGDPSKTVNIVMSDAH
ncbi:hypothetical protein C0Z18_29665 [Trinickia dabaoshanensis]|uniref:Uncharacterized protein n=1 Tax=Trinickia dabaoshanensis TaxID=564714 RepID=A0A2N7VCP6_9BURK|nr:hypothetical protein [Trinickia dabaoshanensis]PMS14919.1 hypothetical protein C0Z18_29665 [Trinickia dabaoshanensis]